jgi:hypothetical protein
MRLLLGSLGLVFLAACGTAQGAGVQGAQSPRELYRQYVARLADVDGHGVCALFTADGATSYATAYQAASCLNAVDKAAASAGDLQDDLQTIDSLTVTQEGDHFAIIGHDLCSLGRFTANKTEQGWLFIDHTRCAATPPA